jgi:type IV pilus assembly protein PilM
MAQTFGLDIGSTQVKVLQAQATDKGFELTHFANQQLAGQELSQSIKLAIKQAELKSAAEAHLALPESEVYTRIIQVPKLSATELASSIPYEAEQYVPVALSEVELYHQVLDEEASEDQKTMRVLLIAVTKERLSKLTQTIDAAGLIPKSVETEMFSLKRLFADRQKTQILLQMGHRTTDMMILDKGNCLSIHSLATGSLSMTKTLMNELSLTEAQAEEYKKTYGIKDDLLEGKVAVLLKPQLTGVIDQISKALIYLQQQGFNKKADQLVLSGGGALLPGLTSFLVEKLNIEVVVGDPFARFVKDEKFNQLVSQVNNPQLSTVVSLALKGLI